MWRVLALLCALALVACSQAPEKPRRTAQERKQAGEVLLSKTPQPRTYRIGENQLLVFYVPLNAIGGMVEYQRCLVWRDSEFKTASIQCPTDSSDVELEGPQPDPPYRP